MTTGGPGDQQGNDYPGYQGDQSPYYWQQGGGHQSGGQLGGGFPQGYPSGGYPPPERSPWSSPVVLVAAAAGVLLVVGGILAAFLLLPSGDDDPDASPGPSTTTHTVTQSPSSPPPQQSGTGQETVTVTPPPGTVTTPPPTTDTDRPDPTVPDTDWQGFTAGPRCDGATDPALAILATNRSRVIICRVGERGGLYYKGVADGNLKHIDFPTQEGKYYFARSGSFEYIVSPSGLVIRQNGNTIGDEPAVAYWSQ
ncbi:hypothetical protein M2359_001939 [Gordonia amarae]|uniref:Serine/threonine protein kinase n=1 Tax=Gordonia amarae NBRC 15530 TaxID=1075090 RepID=G7GSH5_9ACTN|nr:hypothetical protein [Gordonia amarae]MCS3878310.1 hypothetical protein [Gordonia amarae]GAB06550.1 hypothetical protein GOAMR_54_00600 [Gordonia amarae NBRC 15530]